MIRSFDFIKGVAQETPIYYIDNENECIAARTYWKCSYLSHYTLPGYDGNMIIDAEHENGDVEYVKAKSIKVVDPKEIVADMVVQWIDGVDDDLCSSVVSMLELKK